MTYIPNILIELHNVYTYLDMEKKTTEQKLFNRIMYHIYFGHYEMALIIFLAIEEDIYNMELSNEAIKSLLAASKEIKSASA